MSGPHPSLHQVLHRRTFLAGLGTSVLLAGCGGAASPADAKGPSFSGTGDEAAPLYALQSGFADGLRTAWTAFEVGHRARGPFFLFGANAVPVVNGLPEELVGTLTAPDGTTVDVELRRHGDGVPSPYFLLDFVPPVEGIYELIAAVNGEHQASQFYVAEAGELSLVQPQDRMRPVDTATFDKPRGFDPVCTRFDPCPFHEHNLADVIDNGRPTALLIATPGFCQTSICGPSVELLIELAPGDDIDVVHAEVYTQPGKADPRTGLEELVAPILGVYGMDFEPSFVVADAAGLVTARLDFAFDRSEMAAALATV